MEETGRSDAGLDFVTLPSQIASAIKPYSIPMTVALVFLRPFLILIILCQAVNCIGQTPVSGGLYSNTIWTAANSPYLVVDEVIVFPDVTLTIEPGVVVMFDEDEKLTVRGELIAVGTEQDSIKFTTSATPGVVGSWHGITLGGSVAGIGEFEYCTIEYSHYGIDFVWGWGGSVPSSIQKCAFRNNLIGIYGYGSYTLSISDCLFSNNSKGTQTGQISISNCVFFNNTIGVGGGSGSGYSTISNSIFCGNQKGIFKSGIVENSLLKNNRIGIEYGVRPYNSIIINNEIGIKAVDETGTGNVICDNDTNLMNLNPTAIDASGNCWCSNNATTIGNSVWDGYDNPQLGLVTYLPTAPCVDWSMYDTLSCYNVAATYLLFNSLVHIAEIESSSLSVYPNPFTFQAQLNYNIPHDVPPTLQLTDMLGRVVQKVQLPSNEGTYTFDAAELGTGVYLCTLLNGTEIMATQKVIVK